MNTDTPENAHTTVSTPIPWAKSASLHQSVIPVELIETILVQKDILLRHETLDTMTGPWVYTETTDEIERVSRIERFVKSDPKLWDPIVAICLETAVGARAPHFKLFKDKINFMPPGGEGFKPHQDISAGWAKYSPYHISIAVPLIPTSTENGCLHVSTLATPGERLTPEFQDLPDDSHVYVPMPTNLGDIIVFDSCIPHRSYSNRSETERPILYMTFTLGDVSHYDAYHNDKWKAVPPTSCQQVGYSYRSSQSFVKKILE